MKFVAGHNSNFQFVFYFLVPPKIGTKKNAKSDQNVNIFQKNKQHHSSEDAVLSLIFTPAQLRSSAPAAGSRRGRARSTLVLPRLSPLSQRMHLQRINSGYDDGLRALLHHEE